MNILKKFLCMIVVCAMMLALVSFGAAAETEFEVTASVDYDTSIVSVKVTTPAKYVQKISVVMYEKDKEVTSPADFVRALETKTDGSGYVEFDVQLAEDDPAGYLVVSASGNGTKASVSKDTTEIYFESQTYIAEVTLPAIENADKAEIAALLDEKADMLLVDRVDLSANEDVICDLFLNIRKEDYNNECNDMGTVANILSGVQLIRDLNAAAAQDECLALCEAESTLLTLDMSDKDYKDNKSAVYELFYTNEKDVAPKSITDVKNDLFQSIAMANFNKLDATKVGSTVEKYIEYFGIDKDEYKTACKKYKASEINKAFVGRNFVLANEVVEAFEAVVDNAKGKGSSGGGGGGGSSASDRDDDKIVGVGSQLVDNNDNADLLPEVTSRSLFNDVPTSHWAYDSIEYLRDKKIVNGVSERMFAPDATVTREAFVKMFVLAFDLYDDEALSQFLDIQSHWAKPYVASAQLKKIVTGIDRYNFGTGLPITRQDAAVMLSRVLEYKAIKLDEKEEKVFSDEDDIAEYAKQAVKSFANAGIINGITETEFRPAGNLTRAQAAKLIYELIYR